MAEVLVPERATTVLAAARDLVRRLRPHLRAERRRLLGGGLFVLAGIGLGLAYPQVIRITIDEGIESRDVGRIYQLALLMLAILAVEAPSAYFRVSFFDRVGRRTANRLSEAVQRNLLRQEIGFFDDRSAADLNSRTIAEANQVGFLLSHTLPELVRFSLFALFSIGLMVYTSVLLSCIVLMLAPVLGLATSKLGGRLQRRQAEEVRQRVRASAGNQETLASVRTVRAFDREPAEHQRLVDALYTAEKAGDRRMRVSALLEAVTTFSSEAAVVLGIWAGGLAIVAGRLTPGELVSFIFYAGLVVRSFRNLTKAAAELMQVHGSSQRLFEALDREPRMREGGGLRPERAVGRIRMEGVHFRYPTRPDVPVLKGLDLEIPPGEFLAVVGPSGMGKSTLGNLIVRFYEPEAGRVLFDDHDVRELDPKWLREQVTLVQQDSSLFARSLEENVRFGSEDASEAEIEEALEAAHARDFIGRQPAGLETVVGERGMTLSGGQRQRIALARALLRHPRVLILDEATSALDSESETIVKDALRKLDDRPTIIMVAHRLSTVVDADRVVLVDDGRVAASGSHSELLQRSPAYRELVESQLVRGE